MNNLTVPRIDNAHKILKNLISYTPLVTNEYINRITNAKIYFKLENLQKTGSFKIRGASYKISLLTNEQKKRGIVAYSSGNHAQAVACAAQIKNIKSIIVMPKNAPKIKINNTRNYGAEIVLYDPITESREAIGTNIAEENKMTLIKPFDDIDIITGQGTAGKEISEQLKVLGVIPDIYLCCVSGGGLIAGSSFYLKEKFSNIECYSVEPELFNDTQLSLKNKTIIKIDRSASSICDSLLEPQPGHITFPINQDVLKGGLSVSDADIKKTIKILAEELKLIVEPGGAAAAASVLAKNIEVKDKIVIVMISGSNIDFEYFREIITESNV